MQLAFRILDGVQTRAQETAQRVRKGWDSRGEGRGESGGEGASGGEKTLPPKSPQQPNEARGSSGELKSLKVGGWRLF